MAKERKPDYAGADNRRRFAVEKRETWTEEDRKAFLENAQKLKPYIDHLTTKAPEKKKSRFELPLIGD